MTRYFSPAAAPEMVANRSRLCAAAVLETETD
jgi:hypothetical protein